MESMTGRWNQAAFSYPTRRLASTGTFYSKLRRRRSRSRIEVLRTGKESDRDQVLKYLSFIVGTLSEMDER